MSFYKYILITALTIFSFNMTGCGTSKSINIQNQNSPAKKVTVTIKRPFSLKAAIASIVVKERWDEIGSLMVGSSIDIETSRGRKTFYLKLSTWDDKMYVRHIYDFDTNAHYVFETALPREMNLVSINGLTPSEYYAQQEKIRRERARKAQIEQDMIITKAYNETIQKNDQQSYQFFLQKYRNSKYNAEIATKLANFEYEALHNNKTIEKYSNFIKRYPNYQYVSKIKSELIEMEYLNAINSNTLNEYKEFVHRYPNSKYSKEFLNKISILEFEGKYSHFPTNLREDIIKMDLKNYLKELDYKNSLLSFRLLNKMEAKSSSAMTYYYAESLQKNGFNTQALEKCNEFFKKYGKSNEKYYYKTLELYNILSK